LDWTPDRIGTREFVERHGIDIDLSSLQPVKDILVSEMWIIGGILFLLLFLLFLVG